MQDEPLFIGTFAESAAKQKAQDHLQEVYEAQHGAPPIACLAKTVKHHNLFARSMKWTPDPTQNPVRKLARRAFRYNKVAVYRDALLARLRAENVEIMKVGNTMSLFDNVISSAEFRATNAKNIKIVKTEPKIKRVRREWQEAV